MISRLAKIILFTAYFLISFWVVLALYFSPVIPIDYRIVASSAFAFLALFGIYGGIFRILALISGGVFVFFWFSLQPSHNRVWERSVAELPWAEVQGEVVTIHGIRNFQYRTETDFTPNYYTKTFNLAELSSVDVILSYWGIDELAHLMLTFEFAGKDYVTFSIETRKEEGEMYSPLEGFFRNYEMIYVVSDERDVIGLRTKYRNPPEDVYLLRLRGGKEGNGVRLFKEYIKAINSIRETPRFYNTATTNCTTQVLFHTQAFESGLPLTWKVLLSGYLPEYLHDFGRLDGELPLEEIMKRGHVNERANQSIGSENFSQAIREGVPK